MDIQFHFIQSPEKGCKRKKEGGTKEKKENVPDLYLFGTPLSYLPMEMKSSLSKRRDKDSHAVPPISGMG
jgi:hypothetical protein